MALKSVQVPPEMEQLFAQAEAVVSQFFAEISNDPSKGTIEINGERYLMVRAASLSVEFFDLVTNLFGPGREAEALRKSGGQLRYTRIAKAVERRQSRSIVTPQTGAAK